jgi:hypothetical protein
VDVGVEWKIDGRRIPAGSVGRELVNAMASDLETQIRREVAGQRCPVHGEQATVNFKKVCDGAGFELTGCCDEFLERIYDSLG